MADFDVCFQWNMQFEDPEHTWEPNPDACPEGCAAAECYAIAGINSGEFPQEYACIAALPAAARGAEIQRFYHDYFWTEYLNQLDSNELAKRVYDSGVNQGMGNAARFLQEAINSLDNVPKVGMDGVLGPMTVRSANMAVPANLVAAFKHFRLIGYKQDRGWNEYQHDWAARALA